MANNNYTVKRAVRIPQLRLEEGGEYPIQVVSDMWEEPSKGANSQGNVTLMRVINLDTGELSQILVGTVLKQLFTDEGSVINKFYMIEVGTISGDNTWREYYLYELEDPNSTQLLAEPDED